MYYGVQYYPEHWPEDRWAVDADMMREAGVNTVRMGEFAWSAYEPREGALDFGWMERALAVLNSRGIRAILCTCSRTPPPWVFVKHPGIANVDAQGRRRVWGQRYTVGLAHPEFAAIAERIDQAVIRHFARHDAIAGWQVDNEVGSGNDCWCDRCLDAFRAYLKEKYETPEALNAAWGEHFWSFRIGDFAEVPRPAGNPQLDLEYRRFLSGLNVDFARRRVEWIRRLDPGKFVTTNARNYLAVDTDARALLRPMDIPGFNHYPQRTPEMTIDLYRGTRGRVFALEQFTRLQHTDAGPGWMRLWAWLAIAHGGCGVTFFRWRCCRWGQEQMADGLLPHSGAANRRYHELAHMGDEIARVGDLIDRTRPAARVALALGYDSRWAAEACWRGRDLDPALEAARYHDAFRRRNVTVDVVDPREELSDYRLVVAPRLFLVDDATASNLSRFVAGGGVLCLTAGSGVVDEFGKSFAEPRPGPLRELAGVEASDLAWLEGKAWPLKSAIVQGLDNAAATLAADELHPLDADVLAQYADGWRKDWPAITRRREGTGHVLYVGATLDPAGLDAWAAWMLDQAGVRGALETPPDVSACVREGGGLRLLFLLNRSDASQRVVLPEPHEDVFTRATVGEVTIPPVDLCILKRETAAEGR
jgi:beta-galactosidase